MENLTDKEKKSVVIKIAVCLGLLVGVIIFGILM